ncbi:MAG: zf-HC2 domain-containing protein [Oscillospiraceae bacterium]|nr:zf-HC2 domain-containing protein [Oscillospiraceae bacterium]
MNSCVEFSELISAYTDGELSDFDRHRVDDHLKVCESCSALIELYREISISVNESCVSAPESLLTGVMEKVATCDNDSTIIIPPKRKPTRIILLRYIPVAACLAIMLLTLPWVMNTLRRPAFNSMAPSAESGESQLLGIDKQFAFRDNADMEDAVTAYGDISGGITGSSSAPEADQAEEMLPAPEMSPQSPTQPPYATIAPSLRDFGSNSKASEDANKYPSGNPNDDDAADIGDAGDFESTPMEIPPPSPSILIEQNETPETVSGYEANTPLPPDSLNDAVVDEAETDMTSLDTPSLPDILYDAYAIITITGKLPRLLEAYEPMPAEAWSGWKTYYMIPQAAMKDLIKEAESISEVSIEYNNMEGEYSVVLHSFGG